VPDEQAGAGVPAQEISVAFDPPGLSRQDARP